MTRKDEIWKTDSLIQTFLQGVRGGIPFAAEQIDIMLREIGFKDVDCYFKAFEFAVFGGRRPKKEG